MRNGPMRNWKGVILAGVAMLTLSAPARAQVSLVGEWSPRYHEDQPDRIPGPELGDYTGLPLTDGARLAADSWDASRLTLREHQCKVHNGPVHPSRPACRSASGKTRIRRRSSSSPCRMYINTYEQEPDDLDGRPPASARIRAAHVAGVLDRQMGRRHPHRLHHAHQAGVDPPQRRAEQREVHDDRALHPARQHHDAPGAVDRSGLPRRAAVAQRGVRAQRAHRRQLAVAVRIRRRDRRSPAQRRPELSARQEPVRRRVRVSVRRARRRRQGRRRDDVSRVHGEAENAAEAVQAGRGSGSK